MPAESTCRRDTSDASGQQWANARREVATPFSFPVLGEQTVVKVQPLPLVVEVQLVQAVVRVQQ